MTELEQDVTEDFMDANLDEITELNKLRRQKPYNGTIVWKNVILFVLLHFGAVIGFRCLPDTMIMTILWSFILHVFGGFGITAGAHRLWSHHSYKAKTPFRVFLMIMNCVALQNDIIDWVRDHRCHHKWTDTHADPHDRSRGFLFAHIGWLCLKKHPMVKEKGTKLDLSDLFEDPVLVFQRRNYFPLVLIFSFLLPSAIPVFFWGESAFVAFYVAAILRYTITLHATWCINSAAHWFGWRPYDTTISPAENILTSIAAVGEGGHNFHHTFPQDYRASEHSWTLNWTRVLIDCGAVIGQVYDRKEVSEKSIQSQIKRKGCVDERDRVRKS